MAKLKLPKKPPAPIKAPISPATRMRVMAKATKMLRGMK